MSDTIGAAIINAIAIIIIGVINLLFLYFKDKSEYETQVMILWKELGGVQMIRKQKYL